jgi:hypothetical protein
MAQPRYEPLIFAHPVRVLLKISVRLAQISGSNCRKKPTANLR